ncbi:hypothetical protein L345_10794, partial [Ophiophagus hannah]
FYYNLHINQILHRSIENEATDDVECIYSGRKPEINYNPLTISDSEKRVGIKLANRHLPILLYTDDAVLLSLSSVGMKPALSTLASYCNEPKHKRIIDSHELEQVKYLGVVFQSSKKLTV